jgi:hypothetical protein
LRNIVPRPDALPSITSALHSTGKPVTWLVIIRKAEPYDEIKVLMSAHSLRVGCKILKDQQLKDIYK